ncbi:MAG: hypothetical protein V2A66_02330 [Pseudomonadota bacterium]
MEKIGEALLKIVVCVFLMLALAFVSRIVWLIAKTDARKEKGDGVLKKDVLLTFIRIILVSLPIIYLGLHALIAYNIEVESLLGALIMVASMMSIWIINHHWHQVKKIIGVTIMNDWLNRKTGDATCSKVFVRQVRAINNWIVYKIPTKCLMSKKMLFQRGMKEMDMGQLEESCTIFKRLITAENPHKTDAHWNLAVCLLKQECFGRSAEQYRLFCSRVPRKATTELLEFIKVLETATELPQEEGNLLVLNHKELIKEQTFLLKLGNKQVDRKTFLDRVQTTLETFAEQEETFAEIRKSFASKIPLRVYSIPQLENLDPIDTFTFCDVFIQHGVATALVLMECCDKKLQRIKLPPYQHTFTGEAEMSKRCPANWHFVASVLDAIIYDLANQFASQKTGLDQSTLETIKERMIKEFVYDGFSIGLESFDC